ncbi:hypothetical protein BJ165DRAFT_1338122, partial [Panaeolus papilionaceus]
VCAVCLGLLRKDHEFTKCQATKPWNGSERWAHRNSEGKLTSPEGEVLYFDWQLSRGCNSNSTRHRHTCAGCGKSSHGGQDCHLAEKN